MSFAVRLLLGTLAVGGAEDSSHHRSASFWSDLDDGSSVPKGAEGSRQVLSAPPPPREQDLRPSVPKNKNPLGSPPGTGKGSGRALGHT